MRSQDILLCVGWAATLAASIWFLWAMWSFLKDIRLALRSAKSLKKDVDSLRALAVNQGQELRQVRAENERLAGDIQKLFAWAQSVRSRLK